MKKRGTLPLLILYHEALVNPFARISKQRPRRYEMPPNRAVHAWTLCGGIVISQRAFTAFLFWAIMKFTRFRDTKTSANKRFLLCLQTFGLRLQNYYIFLICARERGKNIKNSRKVRGKYWMVSEW